MAFRLRDYVTGGFILNKGGYSTWGRLAFRGYPHVVSFELTGYPSADLMGKHTEFDVPENDREPTPEDVAALRSLKDRHVGPTGCMSAEHRAGGPEAERCLFLEWWSGNGQVVIELPVSKVRFLTEAEIAEREQQAREEMEELIRESKARRESADDDAPGDYLSEDDEGEGFNLLPGEFEDEMERKAQALDREAIAPDADTSEFVREMELLDDLMEGKREETPVRGFLDGLEIPPPHSIKSDAEAEQYLKPLLARLAFFGTTMDVCEHCTPKNAWRILVDLLLPELGVYEPLIGSNYVHHVCAYEVCEECVAKAAEWDENDPPC
jgi:hypothetical protein